METGIFKMAESWINAALAFPLVTDKNDTRVFSVLLSAERKSKQRDPAAGSGSDDGEISIVPGGSA